MEPARQSLPRRFFSLLILPGREIDRYSRNHRWLMFGGFLLILIGLRPPHHGIILGVMAVMLGALGGAFEHWREERGLWMASLTLLVLLLISYGAMVVADACELIAGRKRLSWQEADVALGMAVLWLACRYCLTITRENRNLGKSAPKRPE